MELLEDCSGDAGNKISTLILPPKLQSGYILLEFWFFDAIQIWVLLFYLK